MSQNEKALFIIFGSTGDLAYRRLYPALYRLYSRNLLKENFAVIGTARREWSDEYYQNVVQEAIEDIKVSEEDAIEFSKHFYYQSHNVKDTEHYHTLRNLADQLDEKYNIEGNRIFYLSMSPSFFGTITSHLKTEELITDEGFNRVIIEKPFGTEYENSNQLNNEILESFDEEQIYRIDHYLGKDMIQSLLALRFANPLIKPIWNKEFISNIQVTLAEDIGVETRGAFYEQSGALRDMVQNHVLQIVSLLLMEEPKSFDSLEITKSKVQALKDLKRLTAEEVREVFIRGQYTHSKEHPDILDYLSEEEVSDESVVETFIAGQIDSNHSAWENVPLYIRTGKRMKQKSTRVDVVFKQEESALFPEADLKQNVLTIHIGPEEGLSLQLNHKKIGLEYALEPIELTHQVNSEVPDDYEKLILNALQGDKTNFVHWREVAESWKYIDDIREAWGSDASDLMKYPVNTNGPKEADELLEKNGHEWVWK